VAVKNERYGVKPRNVNQQNSFFFCYSLHKSNNLHLGFFVALCGLDKNLLSEKWYRDAMLVCQ
jgi:hypothetical protein